MEEERGKLVCVRDHLAVAAVAASKGDVRTVRRIVGRKFDLDHAEQQSRLALEKLHTYLALAETIESAEGEGALLKVDDSIVIDLVSHGCFTLEQLDAAKRYNRHGPSLEAAGINVLLDEVASILQRPRSFN